MKTSAGAGQDVCPWDVTEDSEDDEDWLFSSIKLYQQLHMFHLSLTPAHMALSPDGCNLALADSASGHLEVYRLPGKLVAASKEEEGLTSNRDFSLVCGTVECPGLSSLQYVGRRSLLTTSSDSQAVSLWSWQAGEDLLQLTSEVDIGQFRPRAVEGVGEENLVVWGQNCLARADMTGLVLDRREVGGEIQSVMTEGNVTWCLTTRGDLSSTDWRQSSTVLHHSLQSQSQSCFFKRGANTFLAAQSEATSTLSLWDVRNIQAVQEVSLASSPGGHIVADSDNIVVSQAQPPGLSIYSSDSLQLVFSHEAHRAEISCLLTHPAVKNLVISADTNNRLQAWVFNSKNLT